MKEESAAAIAILRAAYPRQPFPDESVAFYARKLRDLDPPELVAAIDRLTSRSAFLPTVAEIRREVVEARLALPNVSEAWNIATTGSLRDAPAAIRQATEFVGGRWQMLHDDRPAVIRAQFREEYQRLREQTVLEAAGAVAVPRLPSAERLQLPAGPDLVVGPVMRRAARMYTSPFADPDPPTEEEIQDAIRILERGSWNPDDPASDHLYAAAELVLVQASDDQ